MVLVLSLPSSLADGQTPIGQKAEHGRIAVNARVCSRNAELHAGTVIHEIDDPWSGARWLLSWDKDYPAGPGWLVLSGSNPDDSKLSASRTERGAVKNQALESTSKSVCEDRAQLSPIIRAGDRLVVEEHTVRVDALLDGVALAPAAAGSSLPVRLKFGAQIVRAIAKAPGLATLVAEGVTRK